MLISNLNFEKLTDEEKYFIVMHDIEDLAITREKDTKDTDLIIVLGCTPIPLKARILKMMELVKKGVTDKVLLSGGKGWTRHLATRKKEMMDAIKTTISEGLLGDKPSERQLALHERFMDGMKELESEDSTHSYEEEQENKKMKMTESDFMQLIILTNGGLNDVKFFHEPFSSNTKENIDNTHRIIDTALLSGELKQAKKLLIVTSSFHCRRSYLTFKKAFPNTQIIVCPSTSDLEANGVRLGEEMLKKDSYREAISAECLRIIKYSNPDNGSIANMDLRELLVREDMSDEEKVMVLDKINKIEKHQMEVEI